MQEIINWFDIKKETPPCETYLLFSNGEDSTIGTYAYSLDGKNTPIGVLFSTEKRIVIKSIIKWAYLPTGKIKEVEPQYCPNYLDERFDTTID